jgi:pSer/pThr/pTyr-binding forkhead associated (FHA) protein
MWILDTHDSAADRAVFRIPPGSVKTIGRSTGAEFMLDAPLVSRLHCQLWATDEAIQVKDLDSTNGTYVNGKRVASATVQAGDVLRIGRVELKIARMD